MFDSARRGYAPLLILIVLGVLTACREKDPGTGDDGISDLVPPAAIVFSSPLGQVSSIDLQTGEFTARVVHEIFDPSVAVFTPIGNKVFLVDGHHQKVAVLRLPNLSVIDDISLPATPLDIVLDPAAATFYTITSNGRLWHYYISSGTLDTLPLPSEPNRLIGVPPNTEKLWVTSPISLAIYVVQTRPLVILDTIMFTSSPRDIEFDQDGSEVFVSLSGAFGTILHMNTESLDTLEILAATPGVREIALSDDERWLAAVDSLSGVVVCHDLFAHTVNTATVGHGAGNAQFARHSNRLFVQCSDHSVIYSIDFLPDGPVVVDTIAVPSIVGCFAIWEEPN